ncbi:MAG: DUF417 family protein [Spartobacteria bacterium]
MTTNTAPQAGYSGTANHTLENIGTGVLRYGLVAVLLWIGLLKFTAYEAEGIKGLLAHSPFFSWALPLFGLRTLSNLIGISEIVLGLLILCRPFAPRISALGSIGAAVIFLVTLSFILTTPGVWQAGYGFPFPSPMPGQFLAKDMVLLGAALWTAGEALRAAGRGR